jgi:hypothetical protein
MTPLATALRALARAQLKHLNELDGSYPELQQAWADVLTALRPDIDAPAEDGDGE